MIENVRGLLTSPAGSPGDVELCPWCLGDDPTQPPLRALGAVLGSLADLRYDARWLVLRASDVGAPHRRERTFLAAWPAGAPCSRPRPATSARTAAPSTRRRGRAAATVRTWPTRWSGCCPTPKASDGIKGSPNQRHGNGDLTLPSAAASLLPTPRASDTGTLPAVRSGTSRTTPRSLAAVLALGGTGPGRRNRRRRWGAYGPAIPRWEMLTRPAPAPTDAAGRLRADFVEWMQGLPAGWVTATPGLGRPAQLTALGNGVVPQQAARAVQLLAPPFPRCPRCSAP